LVDRWNVVDRRVVVDRGLWLIAGTSETKSKLHFKTAIGRLGRAPAAATAPKPIRNPLRFAEER